MRIGETGRAPADQRCDGHLPVRRRCRACQGAEDEEQEGAEAEQPLLAEDLEKLVVRVARLVPLPAADALAVRTIAIFKAAGADPEDRVVAHHSYRRRPEGGTIAK